MAESDRAQGPCLYYTDTKTKRRGERLKQILSISDESPLKSRVLRDHFEHYDERIDEWFGAGGGDFIDSLFEHRYLAKRRGYFRNFDRDEWVLFIVGDELEVKPLVEAVKEVRAKARLPLVDHVELDKTQ
jgi:hypothetical protein